MNKETLFHCKLYNCNLHLYECLARIEYRSPGCSLDCQQYQNMINKSKVVKPRKTIIKKIDKKKRGRKKK